MIAAYHHHPTLPRASCGVEAKKATATTPMTNGFSTSSNIQ